MHFCAGLPIILVGCKKDLRRDGRVIEELRKTSQRPVTPEEVGFCTTLSLLRFGRSIYPFISLNLYCFGTFPLCSRIIIIPTLAHSPFTSSIHSYPPPSFPFSVPRAMLSVYPFFRFLSYSLFRQLQSNQLFFSSREWPSRKRSAPSTT